MAERGQFQKPEKKRNDFESNIRQRKQRQYQDKSHGYQQHRNKKFREDKGSDYNDRGSDYNQDQFIPVSKTEKPRKYTISIAVPASILDATSIKDELRTYVVGQIARAAVIYSIDEIIVYDESSSRTGTEQQEKNQMALDKMKVLLEYQELPPYLRKYFFGFDKNLRFVGLLNPLNSSHHFKQNEWCEYREGVILEDSDKNMSYADVGLNKNVVINEKLDHGLRVTVRLPTVAPPNIHDSKSSLFVNVVSPEEPRSIGGYYWGYSVRIAGSLSEVVTGSKYQDGYDLIIGTSDKGKDEKEIEYTQFSHALIVFGGVDGLETAIEADSQLQGSDPSSLFHFYINTCLLQQVRTIRTEEAVLISLCTMHDKLCSKGIQ